MEDKINQLHQDLESVESKISCLREDSRNMTYRVVKYSEKRKEIQGLISDLKAVAKTINEKINELTK